MLITKRRASEFSAKINLKKDLAIHFCSVKHWIIYMPLKNALLFIYLQQILGCPSFSFSFLHHQPLPRFRCPQTSSRSSSSCITKEYKREIHVMNITIFTKKRRKKRRPLFTLLRPWLEENIMRLPLETQIYKKNDIITPVL